MNRAGIFAIVGLGAAVGAVAGAISLGKNKGRGRVKGQAPYAAIGAGLIATGAAAVLYKAPSCPPCPPGTTSTTVIQRPPISQGGYTAAVALASAVGAVAGAMSFAGQKPSALLGQQPYAPIGGALAGAGLAALLYPTQPPCPACVAIPPVASPTGPSTPTGPTTQQLTEAISASPQ